MQLVFVLETWQNTKCGNMLEQNLYCELCLALQQHI